MKFNKLLMTVAGVGLVLSSCNLDNDPQDNQITSTYPCANLVIPAMGETFATNASYSLIFYFSEGTLAVSSSDLVLGTASIGSFTTNPMTAKTNYYKTDNGTVYDVTSFEGGKANSNGIVINNLKGYSSSIFNILSTNDPVIPAYPFSGRRLPLVMSYTANQDYTVKTFMPDAIYTGTTTVSQRGSQSEPYTSDLTKYRVVFQKDYKKADIICYNSNFAPTMPAINFILSDLNVEYTRNGYRIYGENLIPNQFEGGEATPNPSYALSSFEFINSSSDLTMGQVKFAMGPFVVTFSGSYVSDGTNSL